MHFFKTKDTAEDNFPEFWQMRVGANSFALGDYQQ
jgi:hypothetical protein